MSNLFTRRDLDDDADMDGWTTSKESCILCSTEFSTCTGLIVLYRNYDGIMEANLFHLTPHGPNPPAKPHPEGIPLQIKEQLQKIHRAPGEKVAVFITSNRSANPSPPYEVDGEALFYQKRLRALVKGIHIKPTIRSDQPLIDIAYDTKANLLQVRHYESDGTYAENIASHIPFQTEILEKIGTVQSGIEL